MGLWVGSLDRSREGESIEVRLAHVDPADQAQDGLEGAGFGQKRRRASGSEPTALQISSLYWTGLPAARDSGKMH